MTRYESGTRVPPDSIFWYISSLRSKMRNASSRLSSRSTYVQSPTSGLSLEERLDGVALLVGDVGP